MKARPELIVHGLISIIWVSMALGICVKIALLGNEEATLAKLRGGDYKARVELDTSHDRLHEELDQATRPATLELALRQLGKPIPDTVSMLGDGSVGPSDH